MWPYFLLHPQAWLPVESEMQFACWLWQSSQEACCWWVAWESLCPRQNDPPHHFTLKNNHEIMSSTCCKTFFHVYKTTSSWSSKLFGSWWELGGISQNKSHPFCSEAWMRLVDVLPRLLVAQHVQVQTQRESTKGDSTNCFLSPHCYCHYQHHRHGRLRVQLRSHILIYVTQQRLRAWLPALWCSIRTWGAIDDSHTLIEGGLNSGLQVYASCASVLSPVLKRHAWA